MKYTLVTPGRVSMLLSLLYIKTAMQILDVPAKILFASAHLKFSPALRRSLVVDVPLRHEKERPLEKSYQTNIFLSKMRRDITWRDTELFSTHIRNTFTNIVWYYNVYSKVITRILLAVHSYIFFKNLINSDQNSISGWNVLSLTLTHCLWLVLLHPL